MFDTKKLMLEEITSRDYDVLRASWCLDLKSPLPDSSSRFNLRFVRIAIPLPYGSFESVCRDALDAPSLVRRVSVRGERNPETGKYSWLRLYPQDQGANPAQNIELYAAAARAAGFMCVNLKTSVVDNNVYRDHEIGFEAVDGKVVSVNIKVPGVDMGKYCCDGARPFCRDDRILGLLPHNWVPIGASDAQQAYRFSHPRPGQ